MSNMSRRHSGTLYSANPSTPNVDGVNVGGVNTFINFILCSQCFVYNVVYIYICLILTLYI